MTFFHYFYFMRNFSLIAFVKNSCFFLPIDKKKSHYYNLLKYSPYISGRLSLNSPQLFLSLSNSSRSKLWSMKPSDTLSICSTTSPVASVINEEP